MSKIVPYKPGAICDSCGAAGAFDFYGDYLCGDCADTVFGGDDDPDDDEPDADETYWGEDEDV